jgi:hypothetical protein
MPKFIVEVTHKILVEAHNRPTAELIAKSATYTVKEDVDAGLIYVQPFADLKIQKIV